MSDLEGFPESFVREIGVIRNSKNIFLTDNGMIGFQSGINLIFSLFKEGDNMVFSPLRSENDLNYKRNLYDTSKF